MSLQSPAPGFEFWLLGSASSLRWNSYLVASSLGLLVLGWVSRCGEDSWSAWHKCAARWLVAIVIIRLLGSRAKAEVLCMLLFPTGSIINLCIWYMLNKDLLNKKYCLWSLWLSGIINFYWPNMKLFVVVRFCLEIVVQNIFLSYFKMSLF